MVAFSRFSVLIPLRGVGTRTARWLPTGAGVVAALAGAGSVAMLPIGTLERLVWTSGVATLLPAAQPPLGATARALLTMGAGGVAGAVAWSALFLLVGPGGLFGPRERIVASRAAMPRPARVRRGDAHPDAPPPRPMTAADLGTPLMEVAPPRVQPLPADLDQPLAAFDPAAVPASPREAVAAVAPLWTGGERIETFELARPVPSIEAPAPSRRPAAAPSIDTLLRRLEESAGRRVAAR